MEEINLKCYIHILLAQWCWEIIVPTCTSTLTNIKDGGRHNASTNNTPLQHLLIFQNLWICIKLIWTAELNVCNDKGKVTRMTKHNSKKGLSHTTTQAMTERYLPQGPQHQSDSVRCYLWWGRWRQHPAKLAKTSRVRQHTHVTDNISCVCRCDRQFTVCVGVTHISQCVCRRDRHFIVCV